MIDRLEPFDIDRFLDCYWQQRPCLIGNWLKPSARSLTELLALADEHELPSRLVTGCQDQANWIVSHGPLDQASIPVGHRDWTVLVQEVDKVSAEVAKILEAFRFLPDWMIDDVMISQAADGGSVGAHVDAYDVFLIQAAGRRRWQLAENFDPAPDPRFELALLENWQPEFELTAEPGDALYLPAGIAHHGVADGPCQTWSVGLRTPSGPELMFFLAEMLGEDGLQLPRLAVPAPDRENPALVHADLLGRTRRLLTDCLALDDQQLAELAGRFLTSWRLWPAPPEPVDASQLEQALVAGDSVTLASTARLALIPENGDTALYVNGEKIDCPGKLGRALAATRTIAAQWREHPASLDQLLELDALVIGRR
jgi:50S ribosomal protein L16 3-hydroxylase